MASGIFYRNVRARDLLELFLLSAITSLLLVRFYLFMAGYPQIGSGGLHIAHMLWGGALMLAALAASLSFLGNRVQRVVAVVGGVGFGVFVDELGKFITRDNNYFYQPTIGLIYAIFVMLYLGFNFLGRTRPLTSREYQLNALVQLEEAAVRDMDPSEKRRVQTLLAQADQADPLTKSLQRMLHITRTVPPPRPSRLVQVMRIVRRAYSARWQSRTASTLVRVFFLAEVLLFVGGGAYMLYSSIDNVLDLIHGNVPYSVKLAIGQLLSALAAAGFVAWGVVLWPRSRLQAYEQFRRATLVNIYLTQFFMFARIEFAALPGFLFNLALLSFINHALRMSKPDKYV